MNYMPVGDDEDGFVDKQALQEVTEQAVKALRGMGLTIVQEQVGFHMDPQGNLILLLPALVRPSAKKKLHEDREARESFQSMMAANQKARLEEEAGKIREVVSDPSKLEDWLFGDAEEIDEVLDKTEANHEHQWHRLEGFCIVCNEPKPEDE